MVTVIICPTVRLIRRIVDVPSTISRSVRGGRPASMVPGAALAAFLTMLACAVPARTAAHTAGTVRGEGPGPGRARSPAFTAALSRAWRSPAAATGVQMALQPGR